MLSEKDFLNKINRLLRQSGYFLENRKPSLFLLIDPYWQEAGLLYWQVRELPLRVKQEAQNLLLAHDNRLELWQNGNMIAQAEWENSKRIDWTIRKFINLPQQIQETKEKDFSQKIKQISHSWLEQTRENPPQSIPFHQATDRLLEYVRKYLNPQANRRDIWFLGIQHFYFKQFLGQLSNASNFFSSDWVAHQLEIISESLAKYSFSPNWESLEMATEIQAYLTNITLEEDKLQICKQACHNLQKAFKFKYYITDNQIFEHTTLNSLIGENQIVLQFTDSGKQAIDTTQYCSLLSDYYLAKLQNKQAFWLYALHSENTKTTYTSSALFAGNKLENAILDSQKKHYHWLIADLRSLNKEAFERGYQKIQEEVNTPQALQAHPKADWIFHLTQNVEADGNLLLFTHVNLVFSQKYFSVRKWIEAQFKTLEIYEMPNKVAIVLILKERIDSTNLVSETVSNYSLNPGISLFQLSNSQSEEEIKSIGKPHPNYWLANENYLNFISLYPLEKREISVFSPEKETIQLPFGISAGWVKPTQQSIAEQESEIIPFWNSISTETVAFFRQNYAKKLGSTQSVETSLLRENLQAIIKFSKQLPGLHKLSLKIFELFPKNRSKGLPTHRISIVLDEINNYQLKINQLSKGSNERRSIFERMYSSLGQMKLYLEDAQKQDAWVKSQLEFISEKSIFYYTYAVLFHPDYWQNFKYFIQLPDFPLRIPLLPNFWEFALAGEKLTSLHLKNKDQQETLIPLILHEMEGKQTTKTVKLRLDKKDGKLWAGNSLIISEIPQEALAFQQLGEKILNKQFLKLRNEEIDLSEFVKQFSDLTNLCYNSNLLFRNLTFDVIHEDRTFVKFEID